LNAPVPQQKKNEAEYFYAVSRIKFVILHLTTFGLYELVWFGSNWTIIRDQEKKKISPFWRAVFGPIYFYELADRVLQTAKRKGYDNSYWTVGLTLAYVGFIVFSRAFESAWWIYLFAFLPFLPVVDAINFTNSHATRDKLDCKWSVVEVLVAIVGGAFLLLAILGSLS